MIPGHVRAHTLWVCILLMTVVGFTTHSILAVVGVALLVLGMFLGDQATHLNQENHQGIQPTWIENQQQKHRWLFVLLGSLLAVIGLLMIVLS